MSHDLEHLASMAWAALISSGTRDAPNNIAERAYRLAEAFQIETRERQQREDDYQRSKQK